jgi:hypothetical protein
MKPAAGNWLRAERELLSALKPKKLVLKLSDGVKLRIQYDFRKDTPADSNAPPPIAFPGPPSEKGRIELEFRF